MEEKELIQLKKQLIDAAIIEKPKDDIFLYLYNLELVSNLEKEERKNIVFSALLKLQQVADVKVKKESDAVQAKQLFNKYNVAICYFE